MLYINVIILSRVNFVSFPLFCISLNKFFNRCHCATTALVWRSWRRQHKLVKIIMPKSKDGTPWPLSPQVLLLLLLTFTWITNVFILSLLIFVCFIDVTALPLHCLEKLAAPTSARQRHHAELPVKDGTSRPRSPQVQRRSRERRHELSPAFASIVSDKEQ